MPSIEVVSSCGNNMEEQRKKIKDHHTIVMLQTKDKFQDVLAELFFLQNGGNMMDFLTWKKKPPAIFMDYVKSHPLESSENEVDEPMPLHSLKPSGKIHGQSIFPAWFKLDIFSLDTSSKTQSPSSPSVGGSTPLKTVSSVKNTNLSLPLPRISTPGQVGRPPTTVMTPEQINEKAKQVIYRLE